MNYSTAPPFYPIPTAQITPIRQAHHLKTPSRVGPPASARFNSPPQNGSSHSRNNRGVIAKEEREGTSSNGQGVSYGRNENILSNGKEMTARQRKKLEVWGAETYMVEEDSLRNDHSTRYCETGQRPQNALIGTSLSDRFQEYPKLAALLTHKHALLCSPLHSIPPTFLSGAIPHALSSLPASQKFDSILLSPSPEVDFEELKSLDLGRIAGAPGFVWLWVGSGVENNGDGIGLEKGRELISSWGYRRCEDIVWLKTNKDSVSETIRSAQSLFTPTLEHCLMGIRGTVRRSTDPWFVHCNVDTDVIVWEGDRHDVNLKPPELQSLIENFCLGTRRLHLYASPHSLRRGWLSLGNHFNPITAATSTNSTVLSLSHDESPILLPIEGESTSWTPVSYDQVDYASRFDSSRSTSNSDTKATFSGRGGELSMMMQHLSVSNGDGVDSMTCEREKIAFVLPFVAELDALRPKSPPPRHGLASSGGLGRGRGAGLGVTRSSAINSVPLASGSVMGAAGYGYSNVNGGTTGGGRAIPPQNIPQQQLRYPVLSTYRSQTAHLGYQHHQNQYQYQQHFTYQQQLDYENQGRFQNAISPVQQPQYLPHPHPSSYSAPYQYPQHEVCGGHLQNQPQFNNSQSQPYFPEFSHPQGFTPLNPTHQRYPTNNNNPYTRLNGNPGHAQQYPANYATNRSHQNTQSQSHQSWPQLQHSNGIYHYSSNI